MSRRCQAPGCDREVGPTVSTCSARCRQRLKRARDAERLEAERAALSEEDRAAIRRVLEEDGHGCPWDVPTPEQVRQHVLTTARWT